MGNPAAGQYKPGQQIPEVAAKWAKALALRTAGATFDQIAAQVGYADRAAAYNAVMSAIQATLREPSDDLRKLEVERLDRLMLAFWQRATQGDAEALASVLKIMDRRSKLLGLDAPTKIAPTTAEGQTLPIRVVEVAYMPPRESNDPE